MTAAADERHAVRLVEGPVVYLPREEFGLIDVAVILARRWYLVVAVLVCAWGVSYWMLSRLPVRYESRGVVQIGHNRVHIPNSLLEEASVVAVRVSREFASHSPLGQKYQGAFISNATFDRGAEEVVTVTARATSPEAAHDFLEAVLAEVVAGHKTLFSDERQALEARLGVIQTEEQRVAAERQRLEQVKPQSDQPKPDQPQPNPTDALLAVQQLSRAQFLQQQVVLDQEAVRLKRDLLNLQSPPTRLISAPTLETAPVEPRRNLIWQVGTGLGLLLGCALAFGIEFLIQVIRRLRQPRRL